MGYSKEIAASIQQYLEAKGWNYNFDEENGNFRFLFGIDATITSANYKFRVRRDNYSLYVELLRSMNVNNKKLVRRVTEYLSRINGDEITGNFEFDYDDGRVVLKITQDCHGGHVSQAVIDDSMITSINLLEDYMDGLYQCMFTDTSVVDIIG